MTDSGKFPYGEGIGVISGEGRDGSAVSSARSGAGVSLAPGVSAVSGASLSAGSLSSGAAVSSGCGAS